MKKQLCTTTMSLTVLSLAMMILPLPAFGDPPKQSQLVGSPACPQLNAQNGEACRFSRAGHEFQVWPNRISIRPTEDPTAWIIGGTGHKDLMFDHTMWGKKDDHISFQCVVKEDGQYYGPMATEYERGGTWATYGTPISLTVAAGAAFVGGCFGNAAGAAAGFTYGGLAAETVGSAVSAAYGNRSWEMQAHNIARDICQFMAKVPPLDKRIKQEITLSAGAPGWKVVGVGDFNGDDNADLAFKRIDESGEVRLRLLNGGYQIADIGLAAGDPGWRVVGVGDFNGDGKADIAFKRINEKGEVRLRLLNGGNQLADLGLAAGDPGWKVVGVGDFNGDGKADIAFKRINEKGEVRLWLLDGGNQLADLGLPAGDPGWKVVGVGDFNGDGKADIAFRRINDTGEVRLWMLDGGKLLADEGLPNPQPQWKLIGIGDFNGDGRSDILWRTSKDGEFKIWLLK